MKKPDADLQVYFTRGTIERQSSNRTPILRALAEQETNSSQTDKACSGGLARCEDQCSDRTSNSVLSLLSFNLLQSIHACISSTQASSLSLQFISSIEEVLKAVQLQGRI
jgi:hypothetical protein